MMTKVISAFNGARDGYQLPLALQEVGLLCRHVSDFYLPDWLYPIIKRKGYRTSSRYCPGIPSKKVSVCVEAAFRNATLRYARSSTPCGDPYFYIDRSLSIYSGRVAEAYEADFFLYSGYAYWAFNAVPQAFKCIFQFHPHPRYVMDILVNDYEHYPVVRWSFANEWDSQPTAARRPERTEEWRLADHIVCASEFTKRSLIAAGSCADNISVAPYGLVQSPPNIQPDSDRSRKCRLLFVGQGVQRKGLHHLLYAWKRISGKIDAELTVVSRRIDPGIKGIIDLPGITYVPGVSQIELSELFSRFDVFVMPSLVEGFGLVYLEALSYGMICIGTTNTGLPEIDILENAKILVPPGDVDALENSIVDAVKRWQRGDISRSAIACSAAVNSWKKHRDLITQQFVRARAVQTQLKTK